MLLVNSEFTADEAQARFPELLERAGAGEEIRITRQGQPAVRLTVTPDATRTGFEFRKEIIRRIQELGKSAKPLGFSVAELKAEGRR